MPVDSQAQAIIDALEQQGLPPFNEMTVEEARAAVVGFRDLMCAEEPVAKVEDRTVPGPAGDIPVRVYSPAADRGLPVLLYFHGGGWVIGTLDLVDPLCRALANRAGCVVVSVDYRMAPEHRYPAAAEDCYAATRWVADHAAELGGDPARVAVAGDSAGGNLAAVVSLMAKARGGPSLAYQLLIYPVTNHDLSTPSYEQNADGYVLTRDSMIWFWGHYLADESDGKEPFASPLQAEDLSGLPPATVITAGYDPLRDEGDAYAHRLEEAGVAVRHRPFPGMIHGFCWMAGAVEQGMVAIEQSAADLRQAFGS